MPLADRTADADDRLSIFREVLDSLLENRQLEPTLEYICQSLSEFAGFDFSGILMPEDGWHRLSLAASHAFPPGYIARLNEVFVVPFTDETVAGSPTSRAITGKRTVVMTDALAVDAYPPSKMMAREFGYRSVTSVPLVVQDEVLGVFNGYSATRRSFTAAELNAIETVAGEAALALRIGNLVKEKEERIAALAASNAALHRHRTVLERAHEIHLRLTHAVIAGADFNAVAQTLAGLIGRSVAVADQDGAFICISDPQPPDDVRALFDNVAELLVSDSSAAQTDAVIVGEIRISSELLGYVLVESGSLESRDLDVRAVEHAATVLALETVKERAARATEERLRSDFLIDLLRGREPPGRLAERARHYGLRLDEDHRVVVIGIDNWPEFERKEHLSEPAGRERRAKVLRLIETTITERLPGTVASQAGDKLTAAVTCQPDARDKLAKAIAEARRRVARSAQGVTFSAGIGSIASSAEEYAVSHQAAEQCADLLHRLGRRGDAIAKEDLGLLGLFVDNQRPEELLVVAEGILGPLRHHDRDARDGGLLATLGTYLDTDCNVRESAERLFVHANTVKYRLKRVEEICDLNLRSHDDLLKVTMARMIYKLLGPTTAPPSPS
ncbi:helix-turn-helix domain-containing protein [Marmoricola sp. URHB0036]|uniref:helix-turn-helix domain-containing protein n=1 Tax=Marmoricola sp. URHB0036 TaxID=1298863 RepID=UPI00041DF20C|nr:helix-turn-helix domain-containing protein [Marmoricola sp. URHB0036]